MSITDSRKGIAATTIQSTAASRPILPAVNWLTSVENVLLDQSQQRRRQQICPKFKLFEVFNLTAPLPIVLPIDEVARTSIERCFVLHRYELDRLR
ncbi:hypothetical protein [Rhizobium leguminosarum]|uniref:hypothetical protein n=1 Tax=Rhizobium leguminosarum TaxID=384 RepID=UPI0021BBE2AB|nr:hypothetical protein [Rhizobium leguminosarum]